MTYPSGLILGKVLLKETIGHKSANQGFGPNTMLHDQLSKNIHDKTGSRKGSFKTDNWIGHKSEHQWFGANNVAWSPVQEHTRQDSFWESFFRKRQLNWTQFKAPEIRGRELMLHVQLSKSILTQMEKKLAKMDLCSLWTFGWKPSTTLQMMKMGFYLSKEKRKRPWGTKTPST